MRTGHQLYYLGRILVVLTLIVSCYGHALAVTTVVTSTDDSGPGSLREALAGASDGDTIDGTGISGTITLTSGELLVTNSVIILGPGPGMLAVNGNAASRVFFLGEGKTVTIAAVTITNGLASGLSFPANAGAGIYNDHSTLTVSNSILSGNSAGVGGGIFNDGIGGTATLSILNSILSSNSAGAGGGIFNDGFDGGSATLTILNSTLSTNSATLLGGGIFNSGVSGSAMLEILDSALSGNVAGFGGGIYNDGRVSGSATLSIHNSALSDNVAGFGGGIFNDGRVSGSATLSIHNSALSDNVAGLSGGGIYNSHATLTVSNSTLNSNSADNGGAIYSDGNSTGGSATLSILSSTLSSNLASVAGGGIYNDGFDGGSATLSILNSTFSGNSATFGGGVYNDGLSGSATLSVLNSTFSGNSAEPTAGGGIYNSGDATLEIGSTILDAGASGENILNFAGMVTSLGYNLSSDAGVENLSGGTGDLNAMGDLVNTNPLLGPLQDNGGPTFTHALFCASPAIDAGTNFVGFTTDQRGDDFPRTVGAAPDIGAFELLPEPVLYTVTTTDNDGAGSLRQAILDANACPGKDTITFAETAYGTITLTSGELLITDDLCIFGPGATNVAVNGNYPITTNRVFHIGPGIVVTIAGLTITNGFGTDVVVLGKPGGGIYNHRSTLTVSNCALSGNSGDPTGGGIYNDGRGGSATLTVANSTLSDNVASFGGGIYNGGNSGSATLTIINSTLSGNSASAGGGIYNDGFFGSATLTIDNSTLSGNSADFVGGGIYNFGETGSATLTIVNSTLSGNSADLGGGGIYINGEFSSSATLDIGSTILNVGGGSGGTISNASGTVTSFGYNLSSDDASAFLNQPTDLNSTDAMLGSLQDNGGPTFTHALMCGSPAVETGFNFAGSATDQRGDGFPRTFSAAPDIGAFEVQEICNQPPVAQCMNVTLSADASCVVSNASIDNGSFDPDAGDSITLSQDPAGPYPLGNTLVTLTVVDTHSATSTCTATVTVEDITDPAITCPGDIVKTNEAGQCSAVVTFSVSASDNCDTTPTVTADPPSGSTFAVGTTNVVVTAVDNAGNTNTCNFSVTVVDGEAPSVTCPGNITATNDAGQCSAVVSFTPSAIDNCDTNPSVAADPPSGSTFAVGTTNVVVTAVDNAGNTNTCSFSVTVVDLEAPRVTCRPAPNASGKKPVPGKNGSDSVNPDGYYQVLARDNCDGDPLIYIKDTASSTVAGPFHDGDVVRVKHAGGKPAAQDGLVVAIIELRGDGLAIATDADGNTTANADGCLLVVRNNSK